MRFDLEMPIARKQLIKLITANGSHLDAKIPWSVVISQINFHTNECSLGKDYHTDGFLHSVYIQYYSSLLTEYYFVNGNSDDRKHQYKNMPKIGLDIDEVLAEWVPAWIKYFNIKDTPTSWFFDKNILHRFEEMKNNGVLDEFYLSLNPKIKGNELPFEPICYITSRPVDTAITEKWLNMHGFPARPVHTVAVYESKVEIAKKCNVEIFVDDRFENFVDFNKNGINCYLMDAEHNQRYDVGHKRIKSLNDLPCLQYK